MMYGVTMQFLKLALVLGVLLAGSASGPAYALKSDRQQPLEVKADSTEGTLGDGTATLRGHVEINQGSLLIRADLANVEKVEGRVRRIKLNGSPVYLQQEIEDQGKVTAEARQVDYEVASGLVTLTGSADVMHPQYHISGDVLKYDLNIQHFQGSGGDGDGRVRIQLDPEMVPDRNQPVVPGDSDDNPDGDPKSGTEPPGGGATSSDGSD